MEVSDQLHDLAALPPRKKLPEPIYQEAGWAPEPDWTQWQREKNPCPCWESNCSHPACRSIPVLTGLCIFPQQH